MSYLLSFCSNIHSKRLIKTDIKIGEGEYKIIQRSLESISRNLSSSELNSIGKLADTNFFFFSYVLKGGYLSKKLFFSLPLIELD